MRQLLATLRHRPAPLAGTFLALLVASILFTWTLSLGATGGAALPTQRLAGAAVVVTGDPEVTFTYGSGHGASSDLLALPTYRRLPDALVPRLGRLPGVRAAVADRSVPLALVLPGGKLFTGPAAYPLTGYGWPSAALTPFRLTSGHAPSGRSQLVLGRGVARAAGMGIGARARLAGRDLPAFTVVGLAGVPRGDPAGQWSVFFSAPEAATLYGHPGQADLIGLLARPGTTPSRLAARVRATLAGTRLRVLTGAGRSAAEQPAAAGDLDQLTGLGTGAGMQLVLISLFVVAGAVALSVVERTRTVALLRAVGATPGQVRRQLLLELASLGVLAGLAGSLPGSWLAAWSVRRLAAHQLVPPTVRAWSSPVELLASVLAGTFVAVLAGLVAARRAGRLRPTAALAEARLEGRAPRPLRVLLGCGALAGGAVLSVVAFRQTSAAQQLNVALGVLLAFLAAAALLAPALVSIAELALRLPLRMLPAATGRLAAAQLRHRARRAGSAVAAVALATSFVGAIYLIDAAQGRAATTEGFARLRAGEVLAGPGPGLSPGVLAAARRTPGVQAAAGLVPTTVFVPFAGSESTAAEAASPGPLDRLLDLDVVGGSLARFGPGDVALSRLISGQGAMGVRLGQRVTIDLADGTPYRARVTAIYSRSLGFGDVLLPAKAAGGGHLGTTTLGQVLVEPGPRAAPQHLAGSLRALTRRYPGLTVTSRSLENAQAQLLDAQGSYLNDLLLVLVAVLAGVSLANTLVVASLEEREGLELLRRVGAGTGHLLATTALRTAVSALLGLLLGAGAAATALVAVTRALTGSWRPYLPWPPLAAGAGLVLALAAAATLLPTWWLAHRAAPG